MTSPIAAGVLWALTRLLLVGASLKIGPFHKPGPLDYSVATVYHGWDRVLAAGRFPLHDSTWQYPPGAAGPLLAPHLLPFLDYDHAFVVCCALTDALVTVLLLRAAGSAQDRPRAMAGCWMWVAGLPLLWTVPWNRFDLMVTALAVAGLLSAGSAAARARGDQRALGALVALGLLVKVWPVLLLTGTARGRATRTAWTAAAATAALCGLLLWRTMPGSFGFLSAQGSRGIQYEAVPALPFQLARHLGWGGTLGVHDGSTEFLGPWVTAAALASEAATVLAGLWLLCWRLRADRSAEHVLPDAALTAVLLFMVTSRVLSPQYLVWLVGLAAVCLVRPGSSQRPVAALIAAACPLTLLVFPFLGHDIIQGSVLGGCVLAVRDLLLLAAAWLSATRLWRSTRPGAAAGGAPPTARLEPAAAEV
ncbi:glycosyltransferase 87 family protein [Streptacidiphilus sp. N1-12]|uniref:Glycosyltransferase 87 family protein n=2 Tax=Streptacidiphilus alkalitolerans TaxID=3342712 RepID=A0ABV6VJN3_9ACTN